MDCDAQIEEIAEYLKEFCIETADEEVLNKMKELSFVYNCSSEDIVDQWVAFSMSLKKNCMPPTLSLLEQMEKEELMKSKTSKHRKSSSSVTTPVFNSTTIDLINGNNYEIPNKENQSFSTLDKSPSFSPRSMTPTCFTPSRKYSSRSGSGDVVCSFGAVQNAEWNYADEVSCDISAYNEMTVIKGSYNFMCEKLRDRASILNDMIQEAAEYFVNENDIEEWGHIHLPCVETVSVIGRICSDSGGRLNAVSLLIEGSQEQSAGQTIPLDVSRLEKFSFFPGQIIAGRGINSLGKKFIMQSLYEGVYPPPSEKVPELANCFDSLGVVVASGPYATSDTFSFEPLWDLMKYVQTNMPHVVILTGPFVDIKNSIIENDELSETYDDVFKKIISEILKHIENLSTKVVLVPSTRDAHHDFVYPTPPFTIGHAIKRLYLASDPCILNVEGVIFAITATDILFHLGKEEISHPQMPDRLGRLCNHILTQRNFYPLYPPNEEMNIDFLHYEMYAGLPVMPHILIVPSDFRYFIKDINGCCCVNPERLTKHSTGGTFARLKINQVDKEQYKGSIINSIRAEILRI